MKELDWLWAVEPEKARLIAAYIEHVESHLTALAQKLKVLRLGQDEEQEE